MKYFIIAGEASGDLHASNLVKEIKVLDPQSKFKGFGGDQMKAAGVELSLHYQQLAVMGIVDVLKKLWSISKILKFCKAEIEAFQPDRVIFIDFSGFNLRIAKWAKSKGFNTHYFIAPQVWASRSWRVKKIKTSIDHLHVTLPFEIDFYKQYEMEVNFVGHPILDVLSKVKTIDSKAFRDKHHLGEKEIIALLPGSRTSEIKKILPKMLSVYTTYCEEYQFVLAMAPSMDASVYNSIIQDKAIRLIENDTYSLLKASRAALVTSGTATLETSLLKVPQVVCYQTQGLTYWIAKRLIHLKYISLTNIILDKEAIPELIQDNLNKETIEDKLNPLLEDSATRAQQLAADDTLELLLGKQGACRKAAIAIVANA